MTLLRDKAHHAETREQELEDKLADKEEELQRYSSVPSDHRPLALTETEMFIRTVLDLS